MLLNLKSQAPNRVMLQRLLSLLIVAAPTEDGNPGQALELKDLDSGGYAVALLDLLAALGAVRLTENRAALRVASVHARYLLLLLRDLLNAGTSLVADWQREGPTRLGEIRHPFDVAVDLLAALDRRRLELLPCADPVRQVCATVGLLLDCSDRGRSYLMVYDAAAGAWQLPGTCFDLHNHSPRAALLHELSKGLGLGLLCEPDDLRLSELHSPLTDFRMSPTYGVLTCTTFHIYRVHLHVSLPLDTPGLRWISEAETLAGCTVDGQLVSQGPLPKLLTLYGTTLGRLPQDADLTPNLPFRGMPMQEYN